MLGGEEEEKEAAVAPDVCMWRCDEVSTAYDVSCSTPTVYFPLSTLPDANVGAAPRTATTWNANECWERMWGEGDG